MITRYQAIEIILNHVSEEDLVLSTTGMISREAYLKRDRPGSFYMIGSMGLVSSLGLGLALLRPGQLVYVLEGDGSALMSLGTLALIAVEQPANLVHVILDNEAYESTGCQPSISSRVSLAEIASASGYQTVAQVADSSSLRKALLECNNKPGPSLLLVKSGITSIKGIPRVSLTPVEIRDRFRHHIESLTSRPTG